MEPEKAKAFIEKLFVKIDKNQSGKIEKRETINWIRELEENYIKRDSIEEFKAFDSNGDRFITFEGKTLMDFRLKFLAHENQTFWSSTVNFGLRPKTGSFLIKIFRNKETWPNTKWW